MRLWRPSSLRSNSAIGELLAHRCGLQFSRQRYVRTMASSTFIYPAFESKSDIRLLTVLPGQPDGPIKCTFQVSKLKPRAEDPYIALSYAWGHADLSESIIVDGQELAVSRHLSNALRSLRLVWEKLPDVEPAMLRLWVDAVCINQADTAEKTAQVRMMNQIYTGASSVVAWLGDQTGATDRGFTLIKQFVQKLELEALSPATDARVTLYDEATTAALVEAQGLPHVNHAAWDDVVSILLNPWFSRVWIIQESLCARKLLFLCGTDLYSSDPLFTALRNLGRLPWLQHALRNGGSFSASTTETGAEQASLAAYSLGFLRAVRQTWDKLTLTHYLRRSLRHQATDPRDKVFALIPISADIDDSAIDYDLSLEKVLLLAAQHELKLSKGCLDILSTAQTFGRVPGVPSWVPCWSEDCDRFQEMGLKYSAYLQQLTTRPLEPIEIDIDTMALSVYGRSIDRILSIHVLQPKTEYSDYRLESRAAANFSDMNFRTSLLSLCLSQIEAIKWRFEMQTLITDTLVTYPTRQPIQDVFWRSLLQDDQHELSPDTMATYIAEEKQAKDIQFPAMLFMTLFPGGKTDGHSLTRDEERIAVSEYNEYLIENKRRAFQHDARVKPFDYQASLGRSLAITQQGFVAWVPPGTVVGDEIYILDGTRIPLLLRREGDEDQGAKGTRDTKHANSEMDSFSLIGDVYLHGCMTGEVDDMLKFFKGKISEKQRIRIV